jgi:hypothetical protein
MAVLATAFARNTWAARPSPCGAGAKPAPGAAAETSWRICREMRENSTAFSMTMAQQTTEASTSAIITPLTTQSACRNKPSMERSGPECSAAAAASMAVAGST